MTEFSMDGVVDALNAAGFKAYTEQTGGGCATIYAGERYVDGEGDTRFQILAGPGWFAGEGLWTEPRADTDDFYIGPDDDGVVDAEDTRSLSDQVTGVEAMVATRIIAWLTDFRWPAGAHQSIDRDDH